MEIILRSIFPSGSIGDCCLRTWVAFCALQQTRATGEEIGKPRSGVASLSPAVGKCAPASVPTAAAVGVSRCARRPKRATRDLCEPREATSRHGRGRRGNNKELQYFVNH